MSLEGAVTFTLAIFIFVLTPGPGVFAILARAMVKGARDCTALAAGMVVSDLVYLTLACFGLATIAENYAELFTVIRFMGAAYLIYLGYKMFRALPQLASMSDSPEEKTKGHLSAFIQGFLISASNPKVILFYIAFLPTFMDLTVLSMADVVLANVLAAIALMSGAMLVAFGAAKAAKLLRTEKAVRRMNRGAGSIMIGAGAYLALSR
ncbi:threonine transporter [Enterovibrio norvegicus FF-33]|uniref:Threonine transporter n=1 Tax=Enterovibrio norvegicus FF-454 TaxID=1185651 RepID=A0A1E5BYI6_9GAMM|nr:LysE family translocator [Enterovibrio norvegicus]OEE58303.1 threonine transporter [Enterovibrio norvegicus FF-454]OEE67214.1 threonine transporter [Enterovibrio norvegicus FF-33]OEE86983.1 threonine transporter [Enterovibrio norvegicus FF-162]